MSFLWETEPLAFVTTRRGDIGPSEDWRISHFLYVALLLICWWWTEIRQPTSTTERLAWKSRNHVAIYSLKRNAQLVKVDFCSQSTVWRCNLPTMNLPTFQLVHHLKVILKKTNNQNPLQFHGLSCSNMFYGLGTGSPWIIRVSSSWGYSVVIPFVRAFSQDEVQ